MRDKRGYSRLYFKDSSMRLLKSKRSMEIAISTVILIIISILVLAFLIFFFTKSSNTFIDKIKSYFSSSNVDNVVENCNWNVQRQESYEYCCAKKFIKVSSKEKYEISCLDALNYTWAGGIEKLNCEGVC